MAVGPTVIIPLAKKCLSLYTIIDNSMHEKVMAVFKYTNQLDALISFAYFSQM